MLEVIHLHVHAFKVASASMAATSPMFTYLKLSFLDTDIINDPWKLSADLAMVVEMVGDYVVPFACSCVLITSF